MQEIETGVPIPPKGNWTPGITDYPLEALGIGQSYLVTGPTSKRIRNALQTRAVRLGIKVTTRRVYVNQEECYRVWRLE